MKLLHRMTLRALPGPFLGWLGTLMFLLLMQFLIKYLPDIAGKGLPLGVVVELVLYNLAYMLVLAVPMSALLATLMAYGQLAESNAYAVIKNSGVSVAQLIWPTLIVGLLLAAGMTYFNNHLLPEANFRAKNLWRDVRSKKPGFELQEGVFYEGIKDYSILVRELPPASNELVDVTIYDYTEGGRRQNVIKAERGRLAMVRDGSALDLVLERGEVHRLIPEPSPEMDERYERLAFDRYRLRLDLSEFAFERSDLREGYRSDRTTPTADMIAFVDSLEASVRQTTQDIQNFPLALVADSTWAAEPPDEATLPAPPAADTADAARWVLGGLSPPVQRALYDEALEEARHVRNRIDDAGRTIRWEAQRADRYRVEIHKKYSIALACLIFVLIGAPLGLSIRRGGLGVIGGVALGIFMFYWVTLVQGEKLADRGFLPPWIGMWIANLVMLLVGLWLVFYVTLDLRATPPLRKRFLQWLRR
ncbi:MAG: LptF/LptG family permease [Bacteroidetes bacterium]|jgi:lipopolysaccharide export system permease protein|nr:LptF/LptG family permease [Bacteroidota bacterium]